jgi:processive 1,2-diacylglycerol beta-glucosyltransferase
MRILILSASVGAGHMRAAQAVELAARQLLPDAHVQNVDVLTLTNAAFRKLYGEAYLDLVNKAPHVLGYMYDYLDRPRKKDSARDAFRRALEKLNMRDLRKLLLEDPAGPWDVAICTHFLPAEIIAGLKKRGKLDLPLLTVTTDFETHRLWVNQPCDAYTTATEEGRIYLAAIGADRGISPSQIHVTGIPIHPVFAKDKPHPAALKSLGLSADIPVVLQVAGGFGVGPIEELYRALLSIESPTQFLVVCGKNAEVKKKLDALPIPPRHHATIFGFTDRMDELMAAADLVLTKPGGLTSSECLARGTPLAIINPIPGQETRNSDYLLENGAAIKVSSPAVLPYKVSTLLNDKPRLSRLQKSAKALGTPNAAFDVVNLALNLAT